MIQFIVVSSFFLQDYISFILSLVSFPQNRNCCRNPSVYSLSIFELLTWNAFLILDSLKLLFHILEENLLLSSWSYPLLRILYFLLLRHYVYLIFYSLSWRHASFLSSWIFFFQENGLSVIQFLHFVIISFGWREKTHASSPSTSGKTHEKPSVIQTRNEEVSRLLSQLIKEEMTKEE